MTRVPPTKTKYECPWCGQCLIDTHPDKHIYFDEECIKLLSHVYEPCYKIELSCKNIKCNFGNHYKTISDEEFEKRKELVDLYYKK